MKIAKLVLILALLVPSIGWSLSFTVGSAAGVSVSEAELMSALRAGKGKVKGVPIVVKAGANVPAPMKQKWMANQLSGSDAPKEGAASDNVVFVESF